jgi:DNA-binding NtrC family response regulator
MESSRPSAPWRTSNRPARNTPARILVADDDDDARELVATALRLDGHEVIAVRDGDDVLALVDREDDARVFDLVVTDLRMPGCGGFRLLDELRRRAQSMPAIIMTSFSEPEVRTQAAARDAILFEKPFDTDDLRTAVLSLLAPLSPGDR